MALDITRKILALFTIGASAPEPSSFAYAQDVMLESMNEAGLLDVEKSGTEPSDKTKVWANPAADPMTDPGTLKVGVDGAYVSVTGENFAKHIAQKGGALKGIYTGNIAMNFYTNASQGVLTIPNDWTSYSWFNSYLNSGTLEYDGATEVTKASKPTITGAATSGGQAIIVAIRET